MTNGTADGGAPRAPGVLADGGRDGDGRRNRQVAIWAAVIGAVGAVTAALITVLLTVHSPGQGDGRQAPSISSISYLVVSGREVIAVKGSGGDLGPGEHVYAFAGRNADLPPWYPSGPAAVSSSGLWSAEITGLPPSGGEFSVWSGVASPPPACQGVGCAQAALAAQESEIAADGPHAGLVARISTPRHVTIPAK